MKTIKFKTDFAKYKKGEVVKFIVDNHAETIISKGVAEEYTEQPQKQTKKSGK